MTWTYAQPPVVPWCSNCEQSSCKCGDKRFWQAKEASERKAREEAAQLERLKTAPPHERVLVHRVAPPCSGGLLLEGIATTRLWDVREVPLAAGLVRLDGGTTYWTGGRDPRRMARNLPVPLLWRHEEDTLLGTMYAASATADLLYFGACIVPPGTPGYDAALLARVWDDVRERRAGCVSFTARTDDDGEWTPIELSLTPKGAHPLAVITRATFPDGYRIERSAPVFDEAVVLEANHKHYAAHARRTAKQERPVEPPIVPVPPLTVAWDGERELTIGDQKLHLPIPIYRGCHVPGEPYERGDMVTWGGSIYICRRNLTAEESRTGGPCDKSDAFTLAVKKGRDAIHSNPKSHTDKSHGGTAA